MPAKRSAMRKIKDVLRLKFEARLSHEKIAAATGMSKGAVTNTVQRAVEKGLSWPLPADLDDSRLEAMLYRQAAPRREYARPDYALMHQELKRKRGDVAVAVGGTRRRTASTLTATSSARTTTNIAERSRARCAKSIGPARKCSSTTAATPWR